MQLIIPLAGWGKRLRPHTFTKPKPLLCVAGKPILQHILDSLSGIKFSEAIFITGYLKEKIEDFVTRNYSFKTTFIEQKNMDGTAGAIRLAKDVVKEDVLILFADTIFDADLSGLNKARSDKDITGLIWVKTVEDYQRFGVVVEDSEGIITKIVEKPKDPISHLANIGLYYVKDYCLLFEGIEHVYAHRIAIKGEYFLTDAFQYMIDKGSRFKSLEVKAWYDCGKLEALLETNQFLLKSHNKKYSKSVNSSIIEPVFIGKDVVIENSVIGPFVSIGDGCEIRNSIISQSIIDIQTKAIEVKLKDSVIGESSSVIGQPKKLNVGDFSEVHFH